MALMDADSLRRALLRVHRGESELIPALHGYEAEMKEGSLSCRTLSFPTTCRFNPALPD